MAVSVLHKNYNIFLEKYTNNKLENYKITKYLVTINLVLTGRLSTPLDSVFTRNSVSSLPNTLAARIFVRVEIGN